MTAGEFPESSGPRNSQALGLSTAPLLQLSPALPEKPLPNGAAFLVGATGLEPAAPDSQVTIGQSDAKVNAVSDNRNDNVQMALLVIAWPLLSPDVKKQILRLAGLT